MAKNKLGLVFGTDVTATVWLNVSEKLTRDELGQFGHLHYVTVVPGQHLVEMLGHLSVPVRGEKHVSSNRQFCDREVTVGLQRRGY